MDDFVRDKLTEWGLSDWIETFQAQRIDEESLYCLEEEDIDKLITDLGPKAKFRKRLRQLKQQKHEEAADSAQDLPSTSGKGKEFKKRKRKSDLQGEASREQMPAKRRTAEREVILQDVKDTMGSVNQILRERENQDNAKLIAFLKSRISDLETDKRKLVGVFGKTGAGKSSLINAVIGEKNLLPSGRGSACTSVMIKVEANRHNSKYVAEIEFISQEEWRDELWSLIQFLGDNLGQKREDDDEHDKDDDDDDNDDESQDSSKKLSAVYGEEWKEKSHEILMDGKYFREIPEFLKSTSKILTSVSAQDLSEKLVKYTRSDSSDDESGGAKRLYWPLVKCVTIKVPNNDLLQHVTLVDLPGNGDRNKSRDKMWKEIVGICSSVWIVAECNRAESEKESWAILKRASHFMGHGGECQNVHFICTKSDQIDDSEVSASEVMNMILKNNKRTKDLVSQQLSEQRKIKNLFNEEGFKVYTVSSREFLKPKVLQPNDTEIPKLQDFLRDLNDAHSVTKNYVYGALGILSRIQDARSNKDADQRTNLFTELEKNLTFQLGQIRSSMEEAYKRFERSLAEGVEKSKRSCGGKLNSVLYPEQTSGSGFHRKLKCLVENNGELKKGKEISLNMMLSSCLTDSIDEDFRKTFPKDIKAGPFNGAIGKLSLDTKRQIKKNEDLELLLTFLNMEESMIKTKMNILIRDRKKTIYHKLTEIIEERMKEGYSRAATFKGQNTLKNMRGAVEEHYDYVKDSMFDDAKAATLKLLNDLKDEILKGISEALMESLELSLKTNDDSIPDVSAELAKVKSYFNQLTSSNGEEFPSTE